MNSFLKYLEFSLKNCPETLITEENKKVLLNLGGYLPDVFAKFLFGYEKKLLDGQGELDFSVSVNNKHAHNNFSELFEYEGLRKLRRRYEQWKNLKNFAEAWLNPAGIINKHLEMAAFEFDFEKIKEGDLVPAVFLGIESEFDQTVEKYETELFERMEVFKSGMKILSGGGPDENIIRRLDELSAGLTDKFRIFQAGLMLSRDKLPVKICFRKIDNPKDNIPLSGYLPESCQLKELERIIEMYGGFFDKFAISVNVSGAGIEKASVECYYKGKKQPAGESRWKEMFDALCENGICKSEIADALIKYPAKIALMPNMSGNGNEEYPAYYAQGLHHIKFTAGPAESITAKAYFWAGFNWLQRS